MTYEVMDELLKRFHGLCLIIESVLPSVLYDVDFIESSV